jgi:hypothetical protein
VSDADDALAQIRQNLVDTGSYLRNSRRISNLTCANCTGFRAGYHTCYKCEFEHTGAADLVGSMIYAGDGLQSGRLMYGYKSAAPGPSHRQTMTSLLALGLVGHIDCATTLVGKPTSHWATVPSLRNIGSEHPLRGILLDILPDEFEIEVAASQEAVGKTTQDRRQFNPALYTLQTAVPDGVHVIVIDDTYTSGAHAQSVAKLVKNAGAAKVSILTVARWIEMEKPPVKQFFLDRIANEPYDPMICPWTGSGCPRPP